MGELRPPRNFPGYLIGSSARNAEGVRRGVRSVRTYRVIGDYTVASLGKGSNAMLFGAPRPVMRLPICSK